MRLRYKALFGAPFADSYEFLLTTLSILRHNQQDSFMVNIKCQINHIEIGQHTRINKASNLKIIPTQMVLPQIHMLL